MDPVVGKITFTVFLLLATDIMAFAVKPGAQMRLTEKGISYVNTLAEAAIKVELQSLKIPDQSGKDGRLSWSLTDINTQSTTGPSGQITLNPEQNGLTWTLANFGISLNSHWRVKYKQGWVKVSDSGTVDVGLNDVSLVVTIGLDQKNGRPSISSKSCSASIGNVHVEFHGGTSFIWNLFKGIVEKRIKDTLQNRVCELVNKAVDVDANEALSKMKVYIEIDRRFLLDYSLVAAPIITSNYLEVFNKGEVYWKADIQECPFSPEAVPAWSDTSSMLYLWLTEYVANSFTWAAHNHSYLQYNVTKDSLPSGHSGFLNTTCSSQCIGSIIPQLAKLYPHSWVEVRIKSSAAPSLKITSQNITVTGLAEMNLVAHTPDGSTPDLLILSVSLSLTVQASIENEKLIAAIVGNSLDVKIIKSYVEGVQERNLQIVLQGILNFVIIPELNRLGKMGLDLPVTRDVKFINAKLVLFDDALMVSTDVQYLQSLHFVSEISH